MSVLAKLEAGRTVLVVDNGDNRNLRAGRAQPEGRNAAGHARSEPVSPAGAQERTVSEAAAPKFSEALAK